jgi:S-ribosylhomocysteine lyase LuxS involved in autoinducer biosynthesis
VGIIGEGYSSPKVHSVEHIMEFTMRDNDKVLPQKLMNLV